MLVYAALIPPEPVRRDLAAVVHAVGGDTDQLAAEPAPALHIAVSRFGNVALADAAALEDVLGEAVAAFEPMTLSFAGGTALEWTGDYSVWAKTAGDTDRLHCLARSVMAAVQRLGFFVDRRTFRTWMAVGEVTATTTAEYLQRLVDTLEAYRGPAWALEELFLLRSRPTGEGTPYEVIRELPLGRA